MIINGPSCCGKTEFIKKLLFFRNEMMHPLPEKIIYCYSRWQSIYSTIDGVEFIQGLNYTLRKGQTCLIIFDDFMTSVNKQIMDLFISGRHDGISVIFITHNLFYKSEFSRTITLNTKFIILFKSARDAMQIRVLSQQIFPSKSKVLYEAYNDSTTVPYGYLLIDMRPNIEDKYRLRTNIFPGQILNVYFPLK